MLRREKAFLSRNMMVCPAAQAITEKGKGLCRGTVKGR